jgi:hypothetical protein
MVLLETVQPLKIYEHTKFHGPHVEWYKFFIHLRSLNLRHLGMVDVTEIKKSGADVMFNGMTSIKSFMKIYSLV